MDGGRAGKRAFQYRKAMGRPRKPLAEVYSQERPVARHFVCLVYSTHFAISNTLKIQDG